MNVLDENTIVPERERLRAWRIHFRSIGEEIGRLGMKDHNEIIPLLHTLQRLTFFTRDRGFYRPTLLHSAYCLVYLEAEADETAEYIRRLLRHQLFRTRSQRMGKVVRVRPSGVRCQKKILNRRQWDQKSSGLLASFMVLLCMVWV